MNSKNLITVATAFAGGVAIAAAFFFVDDRVTPTETVGTAPVMPSEQRAGDMTIVDNRVEALKNDLVPDRETSFESTADGYRADGVLVRKDSTVTLEAYGTGGKVDSVIARALRKKGEETVAEITKSENAPMHTQNGKGLAKVRYDRFFDGIDVEYRWDGTEIEEFFYLSDELKKSLDAADEGLDIVSVMPGLYRENGAFLKTMATTMVDPSDMTVDESPPMLEDGHDELMVHGDVELNSDGNRFALPAAYALDATGDKRMLTRTFAWTKTGLEVTTHVPASYLERATGQVVIDPSLVTGGTAVNLVTWNERNFVKDSTGRLYAGHMGVYAGRWVASYVRSVDGGGLTWEQPRIIEPAYGTSENTHYTPNLVIDSTDTLHAAWADHGHIPANAAEKGAYTSWGHRMRYAYCDDFCDDNAWLPQGTIPKLVTVQAGLSPTAARARWA